MNSYSTFDDFDLRVHAHVQKSDTSTTSMYKFIEMK